VLRHYRWGHINSVYSQALAASGGTPPYENWIISSGTLAAGVKLSSAGVLSGTPTTAGTYNFTRASNRPSRRHCIQPLPIDHFSPFAGDHHYVAPTGRRVNTGYSLSLAASGGTPPYSNWTNSNGALPPGLALSSAGIVSGTPTTAGTYSFTAQVTDSSGASASSPFQLIINPAVLAIASASPLPAGMTNTSYSVSLAATGGTPPYTWSANGSAPGLTFNSTGTWTGTPTTAGTYSITVQVTDSAGVSASASFQLTINPAALLITSVSPLPVGNLNTSYSLSLAAGGGTPPYTNWTTSSGTLPPGLGLSSSGVWSGTPTTAGTYSFTVQVTDSAGASASASFQLTINQPLPSVVAAVSSANVCGWITGHYRFLVALYGTNLAPAGDSRFVELVYRNRQRQATVQPGWNVGHRQQQTCHG